MGPEDRGDEGRHMGPRAKGREKQSLRKKQGNAIKKQTNDYNVSKKLCNFEKIWTFPIMYYHKKNAISLEECYPLYEQTMPISFGKLKLSLFPYSKFLK